MLLITASIVCTYYKYIVLENITYFTDQEAFDEALNESDVTATTNISNDSTELEISSSTISSEVTSSIK